MSTLKFEMQCIIKLFATVIMTVLTHHFLHVYEWILWTEASIPKKHALSTETFTHLATDCTVIYSFWNFHWYHNNHHLLWWWATVAQLLVYTLIVYTKSNKYTYSTRMISSYHNKHISSHYLPISSSRLIEKAAFALLRITM